MTDGLVCTPIPVKGETKAFYAKELGTCIPLATLDAYQDTDTNTLEQVSQYLSSNPPFLTAVHYDIPASPPSRAVEPLVVCDRAWTEHVARLTGPKHVCFISDWNLLERDLHRVLDPRYRGEVIRRGAHEDVPVLLEWTPELLLPDAHGTTGFSKVWNFGTWAYVIPDASRSSLRKWAGMSNCTPELVHEFFDTLKLMFWVKFDLNGVWVLSHKMSSDAICSALRVSD